MLPRRTERRIAHMPYKSVWVNPEKLLTRKGITVYHSYKYDEVDHGRRTYEFVLEVLDGEEDGSFDVRDLSTAKYNPAVANGKLSAIKKAIRAAIDKGELPPKTEPEPDWLTVATTGNIP